MSGLKRHSVFISYSHKDKVWLERLQVHLKPLEDDNLIERWDDTLIQTGDEWRKAIEKALDKAAVAILLVSADFLASDFIKKDELPPLLEAAKSRGVVILPLLLKPSRFNRTPTLRRYQAANALEETLIKVTEARREEILVELANRIEDLVHSRNAQSAAKHEAAPPQSVWNIPYSRNEYFTGRETELKKLEQGLDKRRKVILHGLGGTGKTHIAVEYANRHRSDYQHILWVTADSEAGVMAGYQDIAHRLNLPQKDEAEQQVVIDAVMRWLDSHENWLLIFDSADTPDVLKDLAPREPKGHLLITSRVPHWPFLGKTEKVEVPSLPPDDALQFLLGRTSREETSAEEKRAAKDLAKALGYLALALEQAAAYIDRLNATFSSYLNAFNRNKLSTLEKAADEIDRDTVAVTWLLNFEQIKLESPAGAELLEACAFLAPDPIPLWLFTRGAAELGPELAEALHEDDELALSEVLNPLRLFSLLEQDEDTITVHRLVQVVMRQQLDEAQAAAWRERMVAAMYAALPEVDYSTWDEWVPAEPHNTSITDQVLKSGLTSESAANLLAKIASYRYYKARYAEAKPLYNRCLTICEEVLGAEHPDTATALNNLGNLYRDQGRYDEAEPLFNRSLVIYEEVNGPEHPFTATTLNNLGNLYRDQGRYDEAEPLYNRSLAIHEEVLGAEHPETATTLNNLAGLYRAQGRYAEAEPLYLRDLAISEKVLGAEHPDTATTLNDLAGLYSAQGRYDEAEPLYNRCLSIYERVNGPEHPWTATTLNNLAGLYSVQGRYDEAEPLYNRCLAISEKVLGAEHPDTATTLNNLASLYSDQGRYDEAEPLYNRCLAIREKVNGAEHPETATTLNNLAGLYSDQGRYGEAEPLYNRCLAILKKTFGDEHPNISVVKDNLEALKKMVNNQ